MVDRQPGPAADPRRDVLPGPPRGDRGHQGRRPGVLHRLAGRRGREAHRRARQRGRRGARQRRRARRRRPRAGLALAPRRHRVLRERRTGTSGSSSSSRGAEALLDMRVRTGGSHHQKFVVIRYRDDPSRDVAFVGGMDLAHNRRDDAEPRGRPAAAAADQGVRRPPAVARRAGRDPGPGGARRRDRLPRAVGGPDTAHPPPGPAHRRPTARRGHLRPTRFRSSGRRRRRPGRTPSSCCGPTPTCASGSTTPSRTAASAAWPAATPRPWPAPSAWCTSRTSTSGATASTEPFEEPLRRNQDLRVVVVIPLVPDVAGLNRTAQVLGRERALRRLMADRTGTRRGLRDREPRGHTRLRPRQGVRDRRHLGQHRVRQLQPPLLDARLGAQRGRPRRGLRPATPADAGRRAPRPARRGHRREPASR